MSSIPKRRKPLAHQWLSHVAGSCWRFRRRADYHSRVGRRKTSGRMVAILGRILFDWVGKIVERARIKTGDSRPWREMDSGAGLCIVEEPRLESSTGFMHLTYIASHTYVAVRQITDRCKYRGGSCLRVASTSTAIPCTSWRDFFRMSTVSMAAQAPTDSRRRSTGDVPSVEFPSIAVTAPPRAVPLNRKSPFHTN